MNTIKMTITAVLILTLTGSAALAAGDGWVTDFEAAKASAKTSGKYMLVDFTGSDWCGWCIRLKKEVFSQDHFKTEAPKNFILVELDFPRDKSKLTPKLIAQNNKLKEKYSISGYPTIFLMDAEGKVFAKTGYRAGGPEKYVEHLNSLVKGKKEFDKMIAQADKAKGLAKAKLLDKALDAMPDSVRRSRTDLVKQITELDKDNKAGLKNKYAFLADMDELTAMRPPRTRVQSEIKAFADKCLAKVAAIEKKYPVTGSDKQKLLSQKAMYTFYSGDLAGSKKILETAIAIDDKSEAARGMKRSLAFVNSRLDAEKPKKKTD
ncbi:MAG: thioredoxin family protein [Phycisphaerae bacterium]|jgi:thioredoxin-related protein|nr:thioredoxin family protein [Phycisphaerae bacterium]